MAALGNGNVSKHKSLQENAEVAAKLKASMSKNDEAMDDSTSTSPLKRKAEEINPDDQTSKKGEEDAYAIDSESQLEETETSQDDTEEVVVYDQAKLDVASKVLKQKMKLAEQKKLNDFAANVDDKVRLHEKGWKVRHVSSKFTNISISLRSPFILTDQHFPCLCLATTFTAFRVL